METVEQIWRVVEPYLEAEHLELDDLELVGAGGGRTLRVVIDRSGGIDLDRLSEVSRGLSRLLDHETDLDGPYQLEVTSPGLERKLTRPSHYQKSLGREVVIKTNEGSIRGTLTAATDHEVTVEAERQTVIPYGSVASARTVFRWETAGKPGAGKPGRGGGKRAGDKDKKEATSEDRSPS
jgi:ribosome maturation factor RimP